jgi:ketosteroid isomerase-like protein
MGSRTEHEKVARELDRSFSAGDIEAVLSLLDPAVEWELVGPSEIPYFGRCVGCDEVRAFFQLLGTSLEVRAFEVRSTTATDVGVVAERFERGCFTRNNQCYDMRWCHVGTNRS